ncbi:hypothetical protein CEE35_02820 [Candidatus Aerophobetes bacterium Ae_b3b]|nr:MAG: hypothetical protein CEE35_02820 [Candidatus Aerophobetes bacterium Ae_b3b]
MCRKLSVGIMVLLLSIFVVLGTTAAVAQAETVIGEDVLQAGRPYEGTTLRFISLNYLYSKAIQQLTPHFEKATGMKVEIELYGTEDNFIKQVSELSMGGYAYDIVQVPPFNQPQYMAAGWLSPLDDYLQDSRFTPSAFDADDFFKVGMEFGSREGIQYTLPIFSATILYYYRTDVFDKYGIAGPAETFEELLDISKKIQSDEIAAIVLRGKPSIEQNMWPFGLIARGYSSFFKDYPDDLHPNLTDPNFLKAANLWKELFQYGPPGINTFSHEEVILYAQKGLAAQWIDGHPLAGLFLDPERSSVVGKVAVAKTPRGPKGWFPAFSEHGIGIARGSLQKDAAWEFIKWASSKEVLLEASQISQYLAVTRRSVFADPRFREKYSYFGGTFLDISNETLQARSLYFPPIPEWPTVGHVIARALSEVTSGIKSAQDAFSGANSTVDRIMKSAGYYK